MNYIRGFHHSVNTRFPSMVHIKWWTAHQVSEAFRARLRQFPSLVNCCTIDWFTEWPQVQTRPLSDLQGHLAHKKQPSESRQSRQAEAHRGQRREDKRSLNNNLTYFKHF